MYSKELEDLIDAVIADGKVTDKEKAVIFNRARKEGVDLDELEVYLDGKTQQNASDAQFLKAEHADAAPCEKRKKTYGRNLILIGLCVLAMVFAPKLIPGSSSLPYENPHKNEVSKGQILGLLQSQANLATTEINVRKICEIDDNKEVKLNPKTWKMGQRGCVFPVDISLTYGIDLNKLSIDDIVLDTASNNSVSIKLPEPELLQSGYNSQIDKNSIFDINTGLRDPIPYSVIQNKARETYVIVCNSADSLLNRQIQDVNNNTKMAISSMLKILGVEVNYR